MTSESIAATVTTAAEIGWTAAVKAAENRAAKASLAAKASVDARPAVVTRNTKPNVLNSSEHVQFPTTNRPPSPARKAADTVPDGWERAQKMETTDAKKASVDDGYDRLTETLGAKKSGIITFDALGRPVKR
jgi:hypothetical protein